MHFRNSIYAEESVGMVVVVVAVDLNDIHTDVDATLRDGDVIVR